MNNPIRLIDVDGMFSDFYDLEGNKTHIEDGSTAQYHEVRVQDMGPAFDHYEFTEFDESQANNSVILPERNTVNLTTLIQEAQKLNESNPALQPVDQPDGTTKTFCNFATQNIFYAVATATNNSDGLYIEGRANDMVAKMDCSTTFIKTDRTTAENAATNGGLGIIGQQQPIGSGHITTFSTGDNVQQGEVANVGLTNGFIDLHGTVPSVFGNKKFQKAEYFILNPAITPKSEEPKTTPLPLTTPGGN